LNAYFEEKENKEGAQKMKENFRDCSKSDNAMIEDKSTRLLKI